MADIPENNFETQELIAMANDIGDKTLVYFSTIQVNATENYSRPYVQHKIKMERLISNSFSNYIIIRTSNLVGNNPGTQILYLIFCTILCRHNQR
jgi:dTDP-4-dehydrorhamnose reductase